MTELNYTPEKTGETQLHTAEGVTYLTFPALDRYPELLNAFSTKIGGVSAGMYATMNLSLTTQDDPERVKENYRRFSRAIGTDISRIVVSDQQHTTNLRIAGEEDCGKGPLRPRDYEAIDGFVTDEKNVALCLLYADCVPVYLYDPVRHAIGLVHSGWKGTKGRISAKAIALMKETYGTEPEDVVALIAPSICADCYEVSADLYESFSESFEQKDLQRIFLPGKEGHYQLDLWLANRIILEQAGVPGKNIHITDLCTNCNPDLFFSHRYTKGKRGNLAAVLMLR